MNNERPATATPKVSFAVQLFRPLARAWLSLNGWHVVGEMPALDKFMIIAAPHSTNWDLPHTLAAGIHFGVRVHWMGKASLFKWPFGGFMRWLGGIPVDRSQSNNAVAQMVDAFGKAERLIVVIAPEGTRGGGAARWKSGFYHIAMGAKIPLVLCFIDYKSKRVGVAQMFYPTGTYEADLAAIQAVYAPFMPTPPTGS
jgi:1-acyl-sn-glycerol-3-phosphate acyltransferase